MQILQGFDPLVCFSVQKTTVKLAVSYSELCSQALLVEYTIDLASYHGPSFVVGPWWMQNLHTSF